MGEERDRIKRTPDEQADVEAHRMRVNEDAKPDDDTDDDDDTPDVEAHRHNK